MTFAIYSLLPFLAVGASTITPAPLADVHADLLLNPVAQSPQGPAKKTADDDSTLISPRSSNPSAPSSAAPSAAPGTSPTASPSQPPSVVGGTARTRPGRGIFGGGRAPVVTPTLPEPISQYIP